jgi:hypothetical protein
LFENGTSLRAHSHRSSCALLRDAGELENQIAIPHSPLRFGHTNA